jgi:hypothetical protein
MSEIRLFGLPYDPDTATAREILVQHFRLSVIDVEKTGMLPFLDRDLGVQELPFVVADNKLYQGLSMIRTFAESLVAA